MDNLNSRCNTATKEYKQKYDKLLSLVNGYEVANNTQNESMKSLANIINNTKELISESEFQTLKNEQFVLSSSTKNLSDQFQLHKIKNIKNLKYKKPIFTSKILKKDFRISPTLFNLKRFAVSIHKKKIDRSSFFTANHIHSVINKSVISSKKKKRIIIN